MDIFAKEKRSEVMAKIRSQGNLSTEKKFEEILNSYKISGWKKHFEIFGKPDFAFPEIKLAIFIDGAFWHGHPKSKLPETNNRFWTEKINSNKRRDRKVNRELRKLGWCVIRFWDCDLRRDKAHCLTRLRRVFTRCKNRKT